MDKDDDVHLSVIRPSEAKTIFPDADWPEEVSDDKHVSLVCYSDGATFTQVTGEADLDFLQAVSYQFFFRCRALGLDGVVGVKRNLPKKKDIDARIRLALDDVPDLRHKLLVVLDYTDVPAEINHLFKPIDHAWQQKEKAA